MIDQHDYYCFSMWTFFHTQVCRGEIRISCNSLHLNTFVSKNFDNLELMVSGQKCKMQKNKMANCVREQNNPP